MMPPEKNSEWGYPAGFVTRLIAFVIDLAIYVAVATTLTVLAQFIAGALGIGGATLVMLTLITASASLLFLFFYVVGLTILGGQTVGKRIMGLRIVRTDGGPVRLWPAVKRFIGYALSLPLFWGYLMVLVDNRRQDFPDKLADTFVIYYTVPKGELGSFERHLKAIQIKREAKLAKEREEQLARVAAAQAPHTGENPTP